MRIRFHEKTSWHICFRILLFVIVSGLITVAVDIKFVGTVNDSLFAPTSLDASGNQLAVLEPFSKQLKIYSANGVIERKIDYMGTPSGLCQVTENIYAFCDRKNNKITGIHLLTSGQFDYLDNKYELIDPVDLLTENETLYVLDAGLPAILSFDRQRNVIGQINLTNDKGEPIGSPSSFAYDPQRQIFYVIDQLNSKIWRMSPTQGYLSSFGSFGASEQQITRTGEILCSQGGNVFVTDRYQSKINIYDHAGEYLRTIDLLDSENYRLNIPSGLAIDDQGLLYVASTEGASIQVFLIDEAIHAKPVVINQIYPTGSDTIAISDIKLMATAEVDKTAIINSFEFELYSNRDTTSPIIESGSIDARLSSDSTKDFAAYEARYPLEIKLQHGSDYLWRVRTRSDDTTSSWSNLAKFSTTYLPHSFSLEQNYPNPFNPETIISFTVAYNCRAAVEVVNLLGQNVRNLFDGEVEAGKHEVIWDGRNDQGRMVASGVYFYRLRAGQFSQARKMVLLK